MKDIDDIRRENLCTLEAELGGPANAAKVLEMSQSQFANLRDGAKDSKTGKRRGMRKETARRIEKKASKPDGWLDLDQGIAGQDSATVITLLPKREVSDTIQIKQFDTGGAMGAGLELKDQPGVIESWSVSKEWLAKNVRSYTAAANLCIVTGFGDSMRPTFNPGDPLLVDTGVTEVEGDAVYFFRLGNEGLVKRLQRIPKGKDVVLNVISDNKFYPLYEIGLEADFQVLGRVLKLWRSEDF